MTKEDEKTLKAWRDIGPTLSDLLGETVKALDEAIKERNEARDLARRCHHMIRLLTKFEMSFAMGGGEEKLKALMQELDAQDWLEETP